MFDLWAPERWTHQVYMFNLFVGYDGYFCGKHLRAKGHVTKKATKKDKIFATFWQILIALLPMHNLYSWAFDIRSSFIRHDFDLTSVIVSVNISDTAQKTKAVLAKCFPLLSELQLTVLVWGKSTSWRNFIRNIFAPLEISSRTHCPFLPLTRPWFATMEAFSPEDCTQICLLGKPANLVCNFPSCFFTHTVQKKTKTKTKTKKKTRNGLDSG